MLSGQHIIAPSGQGSDDFLRDTSACLYESTSAPASWDVEVVDTPDGPALRQAGVDGLDARALWQEPSLIRLARHLVRAHSRQKALTVGYDPAERFSRAAVGKQIRKLLEGPMQ